MGRGAALLWKPEQAAYTHSPAHYYSDILKMYLFIWEREGAQLDLNTLRSRPEPESRVRQSTNWATQVPLIQAFLNKGILVQSDKRKQLAD